MALRRMKFSVVMEHHPVKDRANCHRIFLPYFPVKWRNKYYAAPVKSIRLLPATHPVPKDRAA